MMSIDSTRIGIEHQPAARFKLVELAYPGLTGYGIQSHYALSACEVDIFSNMTAARTPLVIRRFLELDSESCRLNHLLLRREAEPTTNASEILLNLAASQAM